MSDDTILFKRRHARLAIAAPLAIAVLAQVALVATVWYVAVSSDRDLAERQRAIVADYVADILEVERQATLDFAIWTDLADAYAAGDRGFLDGRLLSNLATYSSIVTAAIFDASGRPAWVAAGDAVSDAAWLADHCPRCEAAVGEVRRKLAGPDPLMDSFELTTAFDRREPVPPSFPLAAEFTVLEGEPVVVVAAPIAREKAADRRGPYPTLVTVVPIGEAYVKSLRKDTGIATARLAPPGTGAGGVPIVAGADGAPIADVVWDRETPASDLLFRLAPAAGVFMLLFTGLVTALVRWLKRMAVDQAAGEALGTHHATHDPLTGLGNRAFLAVELDDALSGLAETGDTAGLLLIDLDGFKGVNDTHGHAAGDELIRQFADRLVHALGEEARIARLGGDEFAILLPRLAADDAAETTAQRILALARRPFDLDGIEGRVGCSIGIALAPRDAADRTDWLRKADIALYRAKSDGRNRFRVFAPEFDHRVREKRSIEDRLRAALADTSRFEVAWQPVYAVADGTTPVGMEARLNWRDDAGRPVSTRAMARAAEEVGLTAELGTVLLRKVCADAARWPDRVVTVNVPPSEVSDPSFADRVLMVIDGGELSAGRLEIELSDGLQLAHSREALRQLARLRAAGVRLSLDGFGAGYANLSRLRALPLDQIKIAPTLVRGISGSAEARHIVGSVVALARSLGFAVAVEGVDRPADLLVLRSLGVARVQGAACGSGTPEVPVVLDQAPASAA